MALQKRFEPKSELHRLCKRAIFTVRLVDHGAVRAVLFGLCTLAEFGRHSPLRYSEHFNPEHGSLQCAIGALHWAPGELYSLSCLQRSHLELSASSTGCPEFAARIIGEICLGTTATVLPFTKQSRRRSATGSHRLA